MTEPLRFRVDLEHGREVTPIVGGVSLLDLVERYESGRRYTPAGAYAGVMIDRFDFGDLADNYLGAGAHQWPAPGRVWLLGCDCGEVGCWPLEASVTVTGTGVVWSDFRQPFRDTWSYDGFGPFVFPRAVYESAVRDLVERLDGSPG